MRLPWLERKREAQCLPGKAYRELPPPGCVGEIAKVLVHHRFPESNIRGLLLFLNLVLEKLQVCLIDIPVHSLFCNQSSIIYLSL